MRGMAHITGGGLIENVPRVLPEGLSAEIDCNAWALPPIFQWLMKAGNLHAQDMGTTLNAGIGMVVIIPKRFRDAVVHSFKESGETVYEIGHISKGDEPIMLHNAENAWS